MSLILVSIAITTLPGSSRLRKNSVVAGDMAGIVHTVLTPEYLEDAQKGRSTAAENDAPKSHVLSSWIPTGLIACSPVSPVAVQVD